MPFFLQKQWWQAGWGGCHDLCGRGVLSSPWWWEGVQHDAPRIYGLLASEKPFLQQRLHSRVSCPAGWSLDEETLQGVQPIPGICFHEQIYRMVSSSASVGGTITNSQHTWTRLSLGQVRWSIVCGHQRSCSVSTSRQSHEPWSCSPITAPTIWVQRRWTCHWLFSIA
jgi:hypothetical protein